MSDQVIPTPNFEQALRQNFRFNIPGVGGGGVTTEDLFQFTKEKLNKAYIGYKALLKDRNEDSLLGAKAADPDHFQAKADILAYVVLSKQAEEQKKADAAKKRARKQELLGYLNEQNTAEDKAKNKEQLLQEIADLDKDLD